MVRFCPAIRPAEGGNIVDKFVHIRDNFTELFEGDINDFLELVEPWLGYFFDKQTDLGALEEAACNTSEFFDTLLAKYSDYANSDEDFKTETAAPFVSGLCEFFEKIKEDPCCHIMALYFRKSPQIDKSPESIAKRLEKSRKRKRPHEMSPSPDKKSIAFPFAFLDSSQDSIDEQDGSQSHGDNPNPLVSLVKTVATSFTQSNLPIIPCINQAPIMPSELFPDTDNVPTMPSDAQSQQQPSAPTSDPTSQSERRSTDEAPSPSNNVNNIRNVNIDETPTAGDIEDDDLEGFSTVSYKKKNRNIPPIVLSEWGPRWLKDYAEIRKLCEFPPDAKTTPTTVSIKFYSESDYRKVTRFCNEKNFRFYTYQLENDKNLKVVIRGLPVNVPPDDIADDILSQGHEVIKVSRMKNYRTGFDYPLYLVEFALKDKGIFNITEIASIPVQIERYKGNRNTLQCRNCLRLGHSSISCRERPRCAFCAQLHSGRDCPNKGNINLKKCFLCNGRHCSTYGACPVKLKRQSQESGRLIIPSLPAIIRNDPEIQRNTNLRTFADIIRRTPPCQQTQTNEEEGNAPMEVSPPPTLARRNSFTPLTERPNSLAFTKISNYYTKKGPHPLFKGYSLKQHEYATELEKSIEKQNKKEVEKVLHEVIAKVEKNLVREEPNLHNVNTNLAPPSFIEPEVAEPIPSLEFVPHETNVNYEIKSILLSTQKITNLVKPPIEVENKLSEIFRSLTEVLDFLSKNNNN